MRKLSLKSGLLVLALGVGLLAAGCGGGQGAAPSKQALSGTVTGAGSTALLPLLKIGQEEFQAKNPQVTVNISGGGSFTGQNQVASGGVLIGNSDVPLQADLKDKGLVEHKLVGIPFVFIANKDVKVDNLTNEQLVNIMSGKIKNWKDVGGKDVPITLIHRSSSSGSRATIQTVVMKDAKFVDSAIIQDSNGAVRSAIATTPGAIGYVDAAYVDDSIKSLTYNSVKYSVQAVIDGTYPIYSFGRMFTKGEPTGATKAFIEYETSAAFQDTYAEKNGFVPITKMKK